VNTGIWLTASTTAKVTPRRYLCRDRGEIAAFIEVVNQNAEQFGLRREQDDRRESSRITPIKMKHRRRDHAQRGAVIWQGL
jgi:hypothetical protein